MTFVNYNYQERCSRGEGEEEYPHHQKRGGEKREEEEGGQEQGCIRRCFDRRGCGRGEGMLKKERIKKRKRKKMKEKKNLFSIKLIACVNCDKIISFFDISSENSFCCLLFDYWLQIELLI